MKKRMGVLAAIITAVFLTACGGGGLKGTVWVGDYGVKDVPAFGYSFTKPEMTFQMVVFDGKTGKVTVQTGIDDYLVQDKEYELKGKKLLIYKESIEKAKKLEKQYPGMGLDSATIKGELDKDILKIGKVEFKKMKKDEADNLYQATLSEFQTKQDEFAKKVAEYNSKFK